MPARDVLVPGQGMADEDGVGAACVEGAIGLVCDLPWGQERTRVEPQRLGEAGDGARRMVHLAAAAHLAIIEGDGVALRSLEHELRRHRLRLRPGQRDACSRPSLRPPAARRNR